MKANKFWIAGHAGTGKSAVHNELLERGLNSFDGDRVEGLASWVDIKTGEKVKIDSPSFVDHSKIDWAWDAEVLQKLLGKPEEIFLCGSAVNDIDFFKLFDKVFILMIDPQTQVQRLMTRDSDYGKDSRMHASIVAEQKEFARKMLELGAVAIDSTEPLTTVVDNILRSVHES